MEVCVDSVQSAVNAECGGASHIELCANLCEGGTTPSIGMLEVIKQKVSIPVFVIIRPRGGDFLYDATETEVMKQDISQLKQSGADGFVIGCLTRNGEVDKLKCLELLGLIRPLPATFHRAIDMSNDLLQCLDDIIDLGFERVLTSGGCATAAEGAQVISEMVKRAEGKIIIVPGGGIAVSNLREILLCGVKEFHGTAREIVQSPMKFKKIQLTMGALPDMEYLCKVTSVDIVKLLLDIANTVWQDVQK